MRKSNARRERSRFCHVDGDGGIRLIARCIRVDLELRADELCRCREGDEENADRDNDDDGENDSSRCAQNGMTPHETLARIVCR